MSDDVLSVIPTDPHWQPERAAAERAASLVEDLAPGLPDGVDVEMDVTWHDALTVVDCGQNLERIGCPECAAAIDTEWWADLLEAHCADGFATLAVVAPCCGAATSLDALEYDWPCGFARFEIAVWNPERAWFSDEELIVIGDALGHPVRQVRAHI
ncbi:hypothetical protein [Streptomyces sp. NPDC093970]|uniref:hypothetical protein n=1 Tax=Streptomyces sp. NPDC093970 TaxID=3155076 RepID=UPI00344347A4